MKIEESIEETHIECAHRIGGYQPDTSRTPDLQVLNDDACLDHTTAFINEQRELRERPTLLPLRDILGMVWAELTKLVRDVILVKRDEHFLGVGGKVVTVKD
jgi:hypothetical protein